MSEAWKKENTGHEEEKARNILWRRQEFMKGSSGGKSKTYFTPTIIENSFLQVCRDAGMILTAGNAT